MCHIWRTSLKKSCRLKLLLIQFFPVALSVIFLLVYAKCNLSLCYNSANVERDCVYIIIYVCVCVGVFWCLCTFEAEVDGSPLIASQVHLPLHIVPLLLSPNLQLLIVLRLCMCLHTNNTLLGYDSN